MPAASALAEGVSAEQEWCYGNSLVEQLSAEILGAEELTEEQLAEVEAASVSALTGCI